MINTLPQRKKIRMEGYDYSSEGIYSVTVCTHDRECLFGHIVDGVMELNDAGNMIKYNWNVLPQRFLNIELGESVVMPNHIHGIIIIVGAPLVGARDNVRADIDNVRADTRPAPTLGDIICAFKSITTNEYSRGVNQHNWPPFSGKLWQRNYYDHIVHNENELNHSRRYIIDNPRNWGEDSENIK